MNTTCYFLCIFLTFCNQKSCKDFLCVTPKFIWGILKNKSQNSVGVAPWHIIY